jgi:2-polyprenyl-6-methoxyphenol hydroxylase-like FAD-dependent oxidoreductase
MPAARMLTDLQVAAIADNLGLNISFGLPEVAIHQGSGVVQFLDDVIAQYAWNNGVRFELTYAGNLRIGNRVLVAADGTRSAIR